MNGRSLEDRIMARWRGRGRGAVCMAADFDDLADRTVINAALHRLAKGGAIRRLAHGLYDLPKRHPVLGELLPEPERVARALAKQDRTRLQPTGAYAANRLGLSEQVPAKVVFLTDGPSRRVSYGPMTIELRRTTPRNMAAAGRTSGLVIQALRHIGREALTRDHLARLREVLSADERQALLRDMSIAPAWMHGILRDLAED